MTLRTRLMILTILGLALTMAVWGWIQLRALDKILIEQQIKTLTGLADTVRMTSIWRALTFIPLTVSAILISLPAPGVSPMNGRN